MLALSHADACIVIGRQNSNINVRWANNTVTTNGATEHVALRTITLSVGAIEETVMVTSAAPLVQTSTGARSGVIERQQMEDIALKGRDFAGYLKLPKKKLSIIKKAIRIYNAGPQGEVEDTGWSIDDLAMDNISHTPDAQMVRADDLHQVLHLLDSLEEREATRVVKTIEGLRSEVAIGYAQAKAGQFVDGPAVFRRLRERHGALQSCL